MAASRRDFLRRTCAGAAAWNALGLAPGATRACELTVEMDTDERAGWRRLRSRWPAKRVPPTRISGSTAIATR